MMGNFSKVMVSLELLQAEKDSSFVAE